MIKARSGQNIILGLEKQNIKRLTKKGEPIHVKGIELNLPHDIYIVYGETQADIIKQIGAEPAPCPKCGGPLSFEDAREWCHACGYHNEVGRPL